MKDVTGRTLTSGDVAEMKRMNDENAEAARKATEAQK